MTSGGPVVVKRHGMAQVRSALCLPRRRNFARACLREGARATLWAFQKSKAASVTEVESVTPSLAPSVRPSLPPPTSLSAIPLGNYLPVCLLLLRHEDVATHKRR